MPVQTILIMSSYGQKLLQAFEEKIRKAGRRSPLRIEKVKPSGFVLRHVQGYKLSFTITESTIWGIHEIMVTVRVYVRRNVPEAVLYYLVNFVDPKEIVEVVWTGEIWTHIQLYRNPRFFHNPEKYKEELKLRCGLYKVY